MEIIERFFNKRSDLTLEDIKKQIIGENESLELEFKTIPPEKSDVDRKELILKPLVSFLNSTLGRGLLILGIGEDKKKKATKMIGVKKNLNPLKTRESIRSFIFENIKSLPNSNDFFKLDIIVIEIDDDTNLFLIEVKRGDPSCAYYSNITDYSYIRRGDESLKLPLKQFLNIVIKKNYPRPVLSIEFLEEMENRGNEKSAAFRFKFINKGTKPAKNIYIVFFVCSDNELEIIQHPHFGFDVEDIDLKKFNLIEVKNYNFLKTYSHISKNRHPATHYPIYPYRKINADVLTIKFIDKLEFKLYSLIFEETGFTKQEFNIKKEINNSFQIEENIEKRLFKPYLTL